MKKIQNICQVCGNKTNRKVFCSKSCFYSEKGQEIMKIKREQTNVNRCGYKNFFQSPKVKSQIEQIHLKNLGVKHPQQAKSIKMKTAETCQKKYKNKSYFASDVGKKTIAEVNLKKGGNICSLHSKEGKEKTQKTWRKKYIGGHPLKDPIVREKIAQKIRPKQKEIHQKITDSILSTSYEKFLTFDHIIPLFSRKQYTGGKLKSYLWKCKTCGDEFNGSISSGKIPICRNCVPINIYDSKEENNFRNWLNQYVKCSKKRFYENGRFKYEIDVFVQSKNIGIEYNGLYSHSEFRGKKDSSYHLKKSEYFLNKGIRVIHIWSSEWHQKQDIIKSLILRELDLIQNKIDSKDCILKKISLEESNKFLEENHIQGICDSNKQLGLFHEKELVSVIVLKNNEILRCGDKLNLEIIESFGKFLKYIQKSIIIKIDRRFSNGEFLLKYGFKLINTEEPNCYKTNYHDLNFGNDRIWDCGNLVFELKK